MNPLAYVDDVAVFCADSLNVSCAMDLTAEFCEATGAMVNWEKSCEFWLGTCGETSELC